MLHIVNKSPNATNALASCLRIARPGHAILLIEDGVYAALAGTEQSTLVSALPEDLSAFALSADVTARGIAERLLDSVQIIDDEGFVELTERYQCIQSWY